MYILTLIGSVVQLYLTLGIDSHVDRDNLRFQHYEVFEMHKLEYVL